MTAPTEGFFLDLDDRYWLALEATTMRYEERDAFISDDDLLDIAIEWTPGWSYDEMDEMPDSVVTARDALLEALYAAITE